MILYNLQLKEISSNITYELLYFVGARIYKQERICL